MLGGHRLSPYSLLSLNLSETGSGDDRQLAIRVVWGRG